MKKLIVLMRDDALSFVRAAGWGDAVASPVAGDLSTRSYTRLTHAGRTAILMDAGDEIAATEAFCKMTEWLRDLGLSAPAILDARVSAGLLLLEDLGTQSVSDLLSQGGESVHIFQTCIDLLLTMRSQQVPNLSEPTAHEMAEWTRLADQYYPNADPGLLDGVRSVLKTEIELFTTRTTVSLRDFHADNLMWLPDRDGIRKLGLLDYQDAFSTHPVYDLVSLLTDARMYVPPETRKTYIRAYATASGDDLSELERAFAMFSVQRNLRILGIFHRAAEDFGKRHHLPKVRRVYGYLIEAFEHPVFADVRRSVPTALPPPENCT